MEDISRIWRSAKDQLATHQVEMKKQQERRAHFDKIKPDGVSFKIKHQPMTTTKVDCLSVCLFDSLACLSICLSVSVRSYPSLLLGKRITDKTIGQGTRQNQVRLCSFICIASVNFMRLPFIFVYVFTSLSVSSSPITDQLTQQTTSSRPQVPTLPPPHTLTSHL